MNMENKGYKYVKFLPWVGEYYKSGDGFRCRACGIEGRFVAEQVSPHLASTSLAGRGGAQRRVFYFRVPLVSVV